MSDYLTYTFNDDENFISTFDELPLWSAPFGLLLLKHLELKPGITVMDIGSGAGFPLMELASRLGQSCRLYGIDPWVNANRRARQKIRNYGINNVVLIEASASKIPLDESSIDLIVSNLGINNFEDPASVFKECSRVLKTGGKLALTTNLRGHWKKFYSVFYTTLQRIHKQHLIPGLQKEEAHRGTIESISQLFTEAGFTVKRYFTESFDMTFLDGTAFLNHHFVKLGWLQNWLGLFPKEEHQEIFSALEDDLNLLAQQQGGLTLSVPMAFVEGEKIS